MARNRKRSKERRSRRPVPGPGARPGVANARGARDNVENGVDETPAPLQHATPDTELAEAQLARGRDGRAPQDEPAGPHPGADDEEGAVYADEVSEAEADVDADAALVTSGSAAPAGRGRGASRLITFLQGSWRELQRVQWPDRRQVMQATGVVIGFVIVAGLYLGLADTVASKLADLILK